MKYRGYFYVGLATTLNVIIYALTFGNYLWLEGRVRGGVFNNWGRRFRYRPRSFVQPTTEAEIVELVRNSKELRFFGAGRERKSTWIDLVCNDSHGFEKYYAAAEELIKQVGARPHLGKFCQRLHKEDLAKLHQEHFARFLELAREYDPQQKFANEFTRRIFWN